MLIFDLVNPMKGKISNDQLKILLSKVFFAMLHMQLYLKQITLDRTENFDSSKFHIRSTAHK